MAKTVCFQFKGQNPAYNWQISTHKNLPSSRMMICSFVLCSPSTCEEGAAAASECWQWATLDAEASDVITSGHSQKAWSLLRTIKRSLRLGFFNLKKKKNCGGLKVIHMNYEGSFDTNKEAQKWKDDFLSSGRNSPVPSETLLLMDIQYPSKI